MTVTIKNIGGMDVGYFDCDNCDNSVQEDTPEAGAWALPTTPGAMHLCPACRPRSVACGEGKHLNE